MNEAFVAAGEATLFTESVGDRDAPAVLLIMGAMVSGVWWPRPFCAQLAARGRHVIRYDHRDTGRSTNYAPRGATYTTESLADDALSVLDAYNVESAHLVGMSLGGYPLLLRLRGAGHELHPLDWRVMLDAIVEHTRAGASEAFDRSGED